MPECQHTIDDIERIDPDGIALNDDGTVTMWAECQCSLPTTVTAEIADVEVDVNE